MLVGLFLTLTLYKFGGIVVLASSESAGIDFDFNQWAIFSWPLEWGYWLAWPLIAVGILCVEKPRIPVPSWMLWLPLVWLAWQFLAASQTIDRRLTGLVLPHFVTCVGCYFIGLLVLPRLGRPNQFIWGAIAGLVLLCIVGFQQRFGGLDETLRVLTEKVERWQELEPEMRRDLLESKSVIVDGQGNATLRPELLKRIQGKRVFSTLAGYPNAFAGAILLLLPLSLVWVWQWGGRLAIATQWLLTLLLAGAGLGCLYWTGSKGGWLVALAMGLVALFQLRWSLKTKFAIATVVIGIGLSGFAWKYQGYFAKGATSVVARFDYWEAAWKTAVDKPWLGSGPGTFQIVHAQLKRPESEMARLAHNDYLEQASDSGWVGFLAYLAFWVSSLVFLYRKGIAGGTPLAFAVWLGLMGWAAQEAVEFGLYIPALAWPAFLLLGWLNGSGFVIDNPSGGQLKSGGR